MKSYQTLIGGAWVDALSGETFDTFNPYTAQPWARIPRCGAEDVNRAVAAAKAAFESGEWANALPTTRGAMLRRLGDLIAANAEQIAKIETRDNGKLFVETCLTLKYVPQWFYYYAGLADKIAGAVPPVDREDMLAFTKYEPLGVIAAFTAWNAPMMLTCWKMAPILAAGNTLVLKPSEHASASALELVRLVGEAGIPAGVVNVVTGFGNEVGETLVSHPDVAKVSFTGGELAATRIAASMSRTLAPTLFELGGKSANIVFADADMANAVKGVTAGIFAACGQSCAAGSRALVARPIYDEFVDRLVDYASKARLGNPMDSTTQLGPIGNLPQRLRILDYIQIGRDEGADLVLGGRAPDPEQVGPGWFVEPTIFRGVNNRMRIAQEEIFGPVLSVIPFDDDEEAIAIGNDIPFGLAGGVWSTNIRRALNAAHKLRTGTVWINTYRTVSYLVPFGGMKRSGHGRENGPGAIEEFMQLKSYWLSYAESEPEPFIMRLQRQGDRPVTAGTR